MNNSKELQDAPSPGSTSNIHLGYLFVSNYGNSEVSSRNNELTNGENTHVSPWPPCPPLRLIEGKYCTDCPAVVALFDTSLAGPSFRADPRPRKSPLCPRLASPLPLPLPRHVDWECAFARLLLIVVREVKKSAAFLT